jgi:hypothetical protein
MVEARIHADEDVVARAFDRRRRHVERAAFGDDVAAGFKAELDLLAGAPAELREDRRDRGAEAGEIERSFLRPIRDAEPAAEVDEGAAWGGVVLVVAPCEVEDIRAIETARMPACMPVRPGIRGKWTPSNGMASGRLAGIGFALIPWRLPHVRGGRHGVVYPARKVAAPASGPRLPWSPKSLRGARLGD